MASTHLQTEASMIASLLLCDRQVSGDVFDLLSADDFSSPIHKAVFSAAKKVYGLGADADIVLIADEMERSKWAGASPVSVLLDILDIHPVATNIQQYAERIKAAYAKRRLGCICSVIAQKCKQDDVSLTAQEILDSAQTEIMNLSLSNTVTDYVKIDTVLDEAMDRYERLKKTNGSTTGVPTGYSALDFSTCGLQPSNLVIIAARPSMGKSALMACLVRNQLMAGYSVGIFSLEMSREEVADRIIASVTELNLVKFKNGSFGSDDMGLVAKRASQLSNERLAIDDTGGITINEISRKAKAMRSKEDVDIIYIDYLGLITPPKEAFSTNEGISKITRSLKLLAKELKIPVVCLSQLSRKPMERPDKRPMLSDLRDSGSIEQDADVVCFIHREEAFDRNTQKKGVAEIIIAKQRNGPTGMIELGWVANSARFENLQ